MLEKQNFFISLAGGIDTKSDEKQIIPGKLLTLENGVFISLKEIRKRNGYASLSMLTINNLSVTNFNAIPSTIAAGNFISDFNQELVLNDGFNLYSYSYGLNEWVYKSQNTICQLAITPIVRNTNSQTLADSAINSNGLQVFAWEDSTGNSKLSIVDTTSNQIIVSNHTISPSGGGSTLKPKCVAIGKYLVIFYLDSTTNMYLNYITYNNGTFSSPVTLSTIIHVTDNNYDVAVFNSNLYVAYNTSGTSIKISYLNSALVVATTNTTAATAASNCITIFGDQSSNVWLGYASSTAVRVKIFDTTLAATLLADTLVATISNVYNITGVSNGTTSTMFYDVKGSADTNGNFSNATINFNTVTLAGTVSSQFLFLKSAGLQSKAFSILFNSVYIPHVVVSHDANLQPTYFLCNLYNMDSTLSSPFANIAAKMIQGNGGGLPTKKSSLSSINTISSNILQTALLQKDLLYTSISSTGTVSTYTQTGVVSSSYDFTKTNLNSIVLGANLNISGGILSMYDGASVVEQNFHLFPEAITAVVSNSGGHLTDSSTYGYQITYEWTDNMGQLHRSAPSPILSSTTTATGSNVSLVTLTIPTLRITAKTNVSIVVYRTAANGTVYYRLNSPTSPLLNTLTANTVQYIDTVADTSILANEQLYTTGGEVPNYGPPATSILCVYKNRLILIPSDSSTAWWFSKEVIPGSPVEFSNVFVNNIGSTDGDVTATIQMDDKLIFFKEEVPYYITGDGPSPSGANNDFTSALAIVSDAGCVNSQSIILMPQGTLFKSSKGIYLLSRGAEVKYIGTDVEAFNSQNVTSAVLITDTNQVRFTLDNGVALVFDYFVNQWSVFTNIAGISSTNNQGTFTYLKSNGLVLQETPGVFVDNGVFIKLKIVTSWLSLAGIQGFQRIYKALILGKYFSPHKLLVQFAYDFNPINTQQTYIDATNLLSPNIYGSDATYGLNSPYGGQYPTYQWRLFNQQQVCEAIQISIEDCPVIGTYTNNQGASVQAEYGEALSLSAISLELGVKKGLRKMSAARSFGA